MEEEVCHFDLNLLTFSTRLRIRTSRTRHSGPLGVSRGEFHLKLARSLFNAVENDGPTRDISESRCFDVLLQPQNE